MRDWPPLHDYRRSRAVVMGTWDYTHLPNIPAAGNSTSRMANLLTSPLCGWPNDRVELLANVQGPGDVPDQLITAFEDVSDIALFYYVGHGQIDTDDQLCLGLGGTRTEPNRRAATSLPFQAVRRALQSSGAAIKILILDCCFAGLAVRNNTLAGVESELLDRAAGTGAYTMTASAAFSTAWFEADSESERPETIFTKYFADLVEAGVPDEGQWLKLDRLFAHLRENLARDGRPIPERRSVDVAGDFVFAHNAASDVTLTDPASDVILTDPIVAPATSRPLAEVCSDAPSAKDMIGAASDVEILADLIAAADTSPPLAIALIGDWGAGKSSVMLQIQRRVDLLAEISRDNLGKSVFAANVRQIRFNAWDYSDDQLWCGLVDHLFDALAANSGSIAGRPDPTSILAERAAIRSELADQEAEERRLGEAMRAADRAGQPEGFLAGLSSPVYIWRIIGAAGRELIRDIHSAMFVLLGWVIMGAVAYEAWSHWGPLIGTIAAAVAAAVAPASVMADRLRRWHRSGLDITARLRRRLDEKKRAVSQQLADLRERLALIDASVKLSSFLTNRADPGAYQEHRGLIGQVRRDLTVLSEDLASARSEWIAAGSSTLPPLERIILYIDDLDRCPPRRVVEVLEAVHLMLAFELFIVVAAVDARWLIKSLEYHYRELFTTDRSSINLVTDSTEPETYSGPASSADYLDKIFQIPYVLAPPSPAALGLYLQSLLSLPASPDAELRSAENGSVGGAASSGPASERPDIKDSSDRARQVNTQRSETSTASPNVTPQRLRLSQREVEFMSRLGSLLPTPRAAKRLANLYRLVRIGIPNSELAAFAGSDAGGPYQAVQILLAILVGRPAAAQKIFAEIMRASPDGDIFVLLNKISSLESQEAQLWASISEDVARISAETPLLVDVNEYQHWCPILARYSFHTRTVSADKFTADQPASTTD